MPPSSVPCYDIAGNLLFQHSMDAGDRWMVLDAAGQPLLAWDYNERKDATTSHCSRSIGVFASSTSVHRPLERWLRIRDESTGATHESLVERFRYRGRREREVAEPTGSSDSTTTAAASRRQTSSLSDKPRVSRRRLASDIEHDARLERRAARQHSRADGSQIRARGVYPAHRLRRPRPPHRMYSWHIESPNGSGRSDRVAVFLPKYNERGLLASEKLLYVRGKRRPGTTSFPALRVGRTRSRTSIDAKGQRLASIAEGTITRYDFDPKTFRLRVLRTTRRVTTRAFLPARPVGRRKSPPAFLLQL